MSAPNAEEPRHPGVTVRLVGEDGNAFAIIGRVAEAIRREVGLAERDAYVAYAMDAESYDDLLRRTMQTVHVC